MKIITTQHKESAGGASLRAYIADPISDLHYKEPHPAILILPGGAYQRIAAREHEPVAVAFMAAGFNAFVLSYSVDQYGKFPNALMDAMWAVNHIRKNHEEYQINPAQVAVCGFSAGGHLAASLGVFYNDREIAAMAGLSGENLRPDALLLCYPVITATAHVNLESMRYLIGDGWENDQEMRQKMSLENSVHPGMPPAFLWHTSDDQSVPVYNSIVFGKALAENGVPFEMHIFPHGGHGMALARKHTARDADMIRPDLAIWTNLAVQWLENTL